METTKLTTTQKEAIDLVQKLIKEKKIDFNEAFLLIRAIYENEKEIVYIPYSDPYPKPYPWVTEPYGPPYTTAPDGIPWWEQNKIMCDGSNANSTLGEPKIFTYAINGPKKRSI